MSDDIMFNDLLHLTDEEIGSTKIRFIMHFSKSDPIYVFMNNPDELNTEWLLSRKKSNNGKDAEHLHKGENVIGLVRLPDDKDLWLFTCIKHISGPLDRPREDNGTDYYVGYGGEELAEYRILREGHRSLSQRQRATGVNTMGGRAAGQDPRCQGSFRYLCRR